GARLGARRKTPRRNSTPYKTLVQPGLDVSRFAREDRAVRQLLGAVTLLIGMTASASAAAIVTSPADTASMILIGPGLVCALIFTLGLTRRHLSITYFNIAVGVCDRTSSFAFPCARGHPFPPPPAPSKPTGRTLKAAGRR